MEGTEAHVRFSVGHRNREGFVDAVVGKTAIEYEKNLTQQVIFDEGYHQVKEYCAALHNIGIPAEEILGVLSDTVRWYGYSVTIVGDVEDGHLYGPDNIELTQTQPLICHGKLMKSFVDLRHLSANSLTESSPGC